jgi:hypothetical protein
MRKTSKMSFGLAASLAISLPLSPPVRAAGAAASATTAQAAADAKAPPRRSAEWSRRMRSLYKTLSALMTDVSSDERFSSPQRHGEILANAKRLSDLAHDLKPGSGVTPPDKDPSLGIFGSLFADETRRAYRAFRDGNLAYSRRLLRDVPGYCISCHTRNNTGPAYFSLPIDPTGDLKGLERGEFYASTRQFGRALKEFGTVIDDPAYASSHPIEWSRAVKYALAIAVRVRQSPEEARAIAVKMANNPAVPLFMREDAGKWLESIKAWAAEPPRKSATEEGLYAEAVRLLAQARELQKYPIDHSADILYLRNSAAVHDLLQLGPDSRHAGEAYLMAGLCYEVLDSYRLGEIQDIYYEACVRENPHTPLSSACFHRYQESVYFGYTGSSGLHLPQDERAKLTELERLSTPVPEAPASPLAPK